MGVAVSMRAVVCFGLFVLAVALIADDASAISFDDLISRAEEAQHPHPKKEVKRADPEMEEWSTSHLLGLDEPPPQHMFDEFLHSKKPAKKVHHKHGAKKHHTKKSHKKAHKHVAHKKASRHSHLKASKPERVKREVHTPSEFASSLLSSIPSAKHNHEMTETDGDMTLKMDNKHGHVVQMVTTHIADTALVASKSHAKKSHKKSHKKKLHKKKSHKKKSHKKKSHKKKSHSSLLDFVKHGKHADADEVVPEMDSDQELLAPHLPSLPHRKEHHKKAHSMHSLSGMASQLLAKSEEADKAKKAEVAKKKAEQKKEEQKQEEIKKRQQKALGGKQVLELDLSGDTASEEEDDDAYDEESLENFMDDDMDMLIQLKATDADEW